MSSQAALPPELTRFGVTRAYREGRVLTWQGDRVEECFLVLQGRVRCIKQRGGGSTLVLPSRGPMDWIGLGEVLGSLPGHADYTAATALEVLVFSQRNMSRLRTLPGIDAMLVLALARQEAALLHWLDDSDSRDRLVRWLLDRRGSLGDRERKGIATTQAQISEDLGLSRETVNRRLGELADEGLVELSRAHVGIPHWDDLARALEKD